MREQPPVAVGREPVLVATPVVDSGAGHHSEVARRVRFGRGYDVDAHARHVMLHAPGRRGGDDVAPDAAEEVEDRVAAFGAGAARSVHLEHAVDGEERGDVVEATVIGRVRVRRDRVPHGLARAQLPELHGRGRYSAQARGRQAGYCGARVSHRRVRAGAGLNQRSPTVSEACSISTTTGRSSANSDGSRPRRLPTSRGPLRARRRGSRTAG